MKSSVNPLVTLINTPLPIHQDRRESERFYTEVFNTVATSFPLAGCPILVRKFEDIPGAIAEYDRRFNSALVGDTVATPEEIFSYRQCSAILKKLELPIFTKAASKQALESWLDSEASCKEINAEFKRTLLGLPLQDDLESVISGIRKEILTLLGEAPPDLPEVVSHGRFGPGASTASPSDFTHPIFQTNALSAFSGMKLEVQWLLQNTRLAEMEASGYYGIEQVPTYLSGTESWRDTYSRVEFVDYERYEDVPKSISTARSIGVGPNLATFVAQAYDHDIRQRLKNWGLDLTKQEPNQRLAYEGSIKNGTSCTLDLSCATDRVSLGLVHAVLPPAWFRVLYPLRAGSCVLPDGTKVTLEKFSSMGNSLTFSVITLILSALVRSVLRDLGLKGARWRVYGDDVIVPKAIYHRVVADIERVGLKINASKSYSEGFFRESCGHDYFAGVNVRPLFIKKPVVFVTDLYKYLNLIQVVEERCPIRLAVFSRLRSLLIRYIPSSLRIFGEPSKYLDRYIWGPYGYGSPRLLVESRVVSRKPSRIQAYFMRLYARGQVESRVLEECVDGFKKTRLNPGSEVVVKNDDLKIFTLRRSPGREAWMFLKTPRKTTLDK